MAQNRRPEAESRDGSSSEEEEEEEEEEEGSSEENEDQEAESEAESEQEQEQELVKTTSTPPPPKPSSTKKPDSDDDEEESGSGSDSDSDSPPTHTRRPDPNIKPISSKPMEEPPQPPPKATKKPRSKPSSSSAPAAKPTTTTIALPAVAKRPTESANNSNRESKRAKKKDGEEEKKSGDTTDPKKQLFQRLWSEDDEIVILKGMIDYSAKKGSDPVADMNAFHDFIKKLLHVDVTKTQLSDKVRRLKKKYENNASKGKNGEDRTFSKTHEHKAFELSKNIWGGEANGVGGDSTKVNGKGVKKKTSQKKVEGFASPEKAKEGAKMEVDPSTGVSRSVGFDRGIGVEKSVEDEIIKHGLDLISDPKKTELEEKWKKLRVEEVELYLKRVDLIREQTKLVLDVLKSSGH